MRRRRLAVAPGPRNPPLVAIRRRGERLSPGIAGPARSRVGRPVDGGDRRAGGTERAGERGNLAVPAHGRGFGHIDRIAVADLEVAGHEHAVRRRQIQHINDPRVALQVGHAQHVARHFGRFVAEDEDAGRVGPRGIEPADLGQSLDRRQFTLVEGDQRLGAGRAHDGEAPLVLFDEDPVAATHGDVELRIAEEVVEPDPVDDRAAGHGDHGGLRRHADPSRGGDHGGQAAVRTGDRIDALSAHPADDADRGPVAAGAADVNLRVRRLLVELFGDGGAQALGRLARGADAAGERHEDIALIIDLKLGQPRPGRVGRGQEPLGHVLEDGDGDGIAGAGSCRPPRQLRAFRAGHPRSPARSVRSRPGSPRSPTATI